LIHFHRYKRSKFQPDTSSCHNDILHTFQIQSGLTVPSLKRPFWYRRSLHQKFSKAAPATSETDTGTASGGGAAAVDHTLKAAASSLSPPSDSSLVSASAPPHVVPPSLAGKKFKTKTAESQAGAAAAAAGGVAAEKSKIITPVTINKNQTHGAILLPLRLRANGMPLLIVNTHLNCKID
jgi:hypothetical protein